MAGVALIPIIIGLPPVLYPVHIAFLEFIIDPACSTVFENEQSEEGIMKRPPRNIKQPLFDRSHILIGLLDGLLITFTILFVYIVSTNLQKDEFIARSVAFVTMVLCNLALIFANLSKESLFEKFVFHKNKALYLITAVVLTSMFSLVYVPFLSDIFRMRYLNVLDLLFVLSATFICYILLEFLKLFRVNGQYKFRR